MNETESMPLVARRACDTYRAQLGASASDAVAVGWAPGRINIIGEHTDYNEGYVLPAAVNRLVALAGRPADEPFATLYSAHHQQWSRVRLDGGDSDEAGDAPPLWSRYIQATWRELAAVDATPAARGFSAAIVGDVPPGAGLSSSAALEVATAMLARALGATPLPALATARACQQAEQAGAAVAVGIMDQAAACLGLPQHAILLDCRTLDYSHLALPADAAWLVFDTETPHTLAASGYNTRRSECEAAVARLAPALEREMAGRSVRALRDVTLEDLTRHGDLLDETLLRRARHVVTENARTQAAAAALRTCDLAALGALLNASHASLRDDFAVSCPELDIATDIAQQTTGVLGARMMGAGFGGSILALTRSAALAALESRLLAEYPKRTGKRGAVVVCSIIGEMGACAPRKRS